MTIKEAAHNYAVNQIEQQIQSLEEAFLAGYEFRKNEPPSYKIENYEYVDLDLPSGTLWTSNIKGHSNIVVFGEYTYMKGFRLPSPEQVKELYENCDVEIDNNIVYLFSKRNGRHIKLYTDYGYWTNSISDSGYKADIFWPRNGLIQRKIIESINYVVLVCNKPDSI